VTSKQHAKNPAIPLTDTAGFPTTRRVPNE
jgi:hypothetical protein